MHGHGLRERLQRGPIEVGAAAKKLVLRLRTYVCLCCRALITVGPAVVLRGRRFSSVAIGLALALWGADRQSAAQVRRQVSPSAVVGFTAAAGWATLRRWARDVRGGRLFPGIRACPKDWSLRQVAERAAMTLASVGPLSASSEPLLARVIAGARSHSLMGKGRQPDKEV